MIHDTAIDDLRDSLRYAIYTQTKGDHPFLWVGPRVFARNPINIRDAIKEYFKQNEP